MEHSGVGGRRVLVCGGRNYTDEDAVYRTLDRLHAEDPIASIIEGGARGADSLAAYWGYGHWVHVHTVEADWRRHGRAAGPRRNARMLELGPSLVVAFPGGKGTADMVRRARAAGIPVLHPSTASVPKDGTG